MAENLYVGKAGQFVAMSEFLMRGWNVAIPEVDIGDDIFVVRDENGEFTRVQVKTRNADKRENGFSAQFLISMKQLELSFIPELTFFFVVRFENKWTKFVLIKRDELLKEVEINDVGTKADDSLSLYFSFQDDKLICSKQDFTKFVNDFSQFPEISHKNLKNSGI